MKTKTIKHEVIERCVLTQKEINTEKDNYVIVLVCKGNKIESQSFSKLNYYNDLIDGKMELVKQDLMKKSMQNANKMFQKIGLPVAINVEDDR